MWSGGGMLGSAVRQKSHHLNTEYESIKRRQEPLSMWKESATPETPSHKPCYSDKALLILNPQGPAHRFISWLMNLWLPFSIHNPSLPFNNPFLIYEDASPALLANIDPLVQIPLTLSLIYFLLCLLEILKWKVKVLVSICVWLFVTPWTIAHQVPLSMELSRQEYGYSLEWIAIPFTGNIPNPGIKPWSPALQADSLPSKPQGSPFWESKSKEILLWRSLWPLPRLSKASL